ncbi:transcriptional regulator [Streptomyces marincola]|uniref:transcriptional regulator n=1 Tax=Streptomyces marincola TaxID=2878388 RepID=UPI001CF26F18|nr:transcriptional regulator [Streptomyces marincola]UCM91449.1 transcriptional regulator [Streptomyces marincola]
MLRTGLYSVALTVPGRSEIVDRVQAFRGGRLSRIGMGEVAVVTAMTRRIQELDDQFGTRHARPLAANFLVNTAVPYLRADADASVRAALLSATARLCHLAGYMAVDEGLHGLAQRYYVKALEFADAADDRFAYNGTLRGMSVQATDLGHAATALRLADTAAEGAHGAPPPRRAFFAGQQAHAAAQTGDRRTALRHLATAERAMHRADLGGAAFASYDPAALDYHVSQVRWELGDIAGAVASLRASNRGLHVGYQRTTVRRRFMLAERYLRLGHLDVACATWARALDDYPGIDSGRVDERVAVMKALLRPHRDNGAARAVLARADAPAKAGGAAGVP